MKVGKLCKIAFLQALGLVSYIALVSVVFWQGNNWFPQMNSYFGPMIFLTLFAVSALISALIVGRYPFILWHKKKNAEDSVKLLTYTAGYLIGFIILGLLILTFLN